jgi:hypothetical protein
VAMKTMKWGRLPQFQATSDKTQPTRSIAKLQENGLPVIEQLLSNWTTAVLDKLQDFVPQTIRDLIQAITSLP